MAQEHREQIQPASELSEEQLDGVAAGASDKDGWPKSTGGTGGATEPSLAK
jgi:hypothetical protein